MADVGEGISAAEKAPAPSLARHREKDRYALYPSYGALISSVTFMELMFFSYRAGIFFGKFWRK